MRLYIAEGESGEYDDHTQWVVGVFTTRDKAKKGYQSTVKDKPLSWNFNAKSKESYAPVKFSQWESGSFRILPIMLDEPYGSLIG